MNYQIKILSAETFSNFKCFTCRAILQQFLSSSHSFVNDSFFTALAAFSNDHISYSTGVFLFFAQKVSTIANCTILSNGVT